MIPDFKRNQLSFVGTHSLRAGDSSHCSVQVAWVFVVKGNFKGQVLFSEGYGEMPQDYNQRQTTIGFSVSLTECKP